MLTASQFAVSTDYGALPGMSTSSQKGIYLLSIEEHGLWQYVGMVINQPFSDRYRGHVIDRGTNTKFKAVWSASPGGLTSAQVLVPINDGAAPRAFTYACETFCMVLHGSVADHGGLNARLFDSVDAYTSMSMGYCVELLEHLWKELHRIVTADEECKIPHHSSKSWDQILRKITPWPGTDITGAMVGGGRDVLTI